MSGRFDSFKDGILQEFSDELFEIGKRLDAINVSVGASQDALKLQSNEFTKFAIETVEGLERYSAKKREEIDQDINQSFQERAEAASIEFQKEVQSIVASAQSSVDLLSADLEKASQRLKKIDQAADKKKAPLWAKTLIAVGIALLIALPVTGYYLGKNASAKEAQNMMNYIISLDESELASLKESAR